MNLEEIYKDLEDWELAMIVKQNVASSNEHKIAQKEIFNRMIDKKWLKKKKKDK